ncbi:MAG: glycerol-3-phosphate 1-O-acyltransferase PlsY [Clostridiales bacterium]|nr:glycerol-3-phosphate 1-O-acyltransferase PlsY [Clostridiales bacterium]
MLILTYILVAILAYLMGSISTGLLVAKIANGPNLREVGSKNTGASNVLRTMGLKSGLITFVGDCLKCLLAALIGRWALGHVADQAQYGAMWASLFVILGHNWPVFFQFKGGKGVASSCGMMLVCFPIPALISYVVAIAIIATTKFISLGSMCMLTLYAILVSVFFSNGDLIIIGWAVLMAVLCIIRHRANVVRLLNGTESKIGQKVK